MDPFSDADGALEKASGSCRYCPWDRLHEPHGAFLLESRTHVAGAKSSSFSCLSLSAWTLSLGSYPSILMQERLNGFPNNVKFDEKKLIEPGVLKTIIRSGSDFLKHVHRSALSESPHVPGVDHRKDPSLTTHPLKSRTFVYPPPLSR
jgi:hypothetical protein